MILKIEYELGLAILGSNFFFDFILLAPLPQYLMGHLVKKYKNYHRNNSYETNVFLLVRILQNTTSNHLTKTYEPSTCTSFVIRFLENLKKHVREPQKRTFGPNIRIILDLWRKTLPFFIISNLDTWFKPLKQTYVYKLYLGVAPALKLRTF